MLGIASSIGCSLAGSLYVMIVVRVGREWYSNSYPEHMAYFTPGGNS